MKRVVLLAIAAAACNLANAVEIYNNGPVVNSAGRSVMATGSTTYGLAANNTIWVADDFTIAAGKRWDISSIDFFSYQTGATAFSFTGANWSIVQDDVNTGKVVASGSNAVTNGGLVGYRVTATTQTNTSRPIYRVQADIADTSLSTGHYWLRWNLAGTVASGPWVAQTSDNVLGNAQQKTTGVFTQYAESSSKKSAELPFVLNGNVAAVPEPETYAMMLGGLVMLGALARRRKQA
jgi:hypothetical protein